VIALWAALCLAPQDGDLVLQGARILTAAGPEIPKGRLVIAGGKLRVVDAGGDAPAGAKTVDLAGKVVIPGLVDSNSALGIAGQANEDASEVTPGARILDSVDLDHADFKRAARSGVTTVYVGPGNRNVVGGLGAVLKTDGEARILVAEAALKATVGPGPASGNFPPRGVTPTFYARRPTTRMGVFWELRKSLVDAREGRSEESAVLRRALEGKLAVRIAASRATDLETALRIRDEFGLTILFEEAQEAPELLEVLARRKTPILLRPSATPAAAGGEGQARLDAFTRLRKAGLDVALLSLSPGDPEGLREAAIFAVRHGADRDEALRAVTAVPAKLIGAGDRAGTLEAGKDADLVVLSGDPLDPASRVERVMIGGRWVGGKRSDR
jgi:imidazolonepropionase-like amidohydrolase